MNTRDETIFALASGYGRAGIAVIRVSGKRALPVLAAMTGDRSLEPRRATVRRIINPRTGELIDRGLVLAFPAPGSFTGEDCAEFHVHGGPAIIAQLLETLAEEAGLRLAEAGEFTRRAFYNGKMDLFETEALSDLIAAETRSQKNLALRQGAKQTRDLFEKWRRELIAILAQTEALIDFADEELDGTEMFHVNHRIDHLVAELRCHVEDHQAGELLRDGVKVALAGAVNTGKSSLLNRLARRDVAIVSEHAGTTRDVIEVHLDLAGLPVKLCDTAGLRSADDPVEQEGIRRTLWTVEEADIVLLVVDRPEITENEKRSCPPEKTILVRNKADLLHRTASWQGDAAYLGSCLVSARTGSGIDGLLAQLTSRAQSLLGGSERTLVSRVRHRQCLQGVLERLLAAGDKREDDLDLFCEDIREAARHLARLTGRIHVDDMLDVIFSEFCIGK